MSRASIKTKKTNHHLVSKISKKNPKRKIFELKSNSKNHRFAQKNINSETELGEPWFKTTLRSIGDGVIATNSSGIVTFMNLIAENLTGWKIKDAIGKKIEKVFSIINEFSNKKLSNPVRIVLKTGKPSLLANHTVLISKQKKRFIIDDSVAPIKNDQKKIVGAVLVFRDVTEKRLAEREAGKLALVVHNSNDAIITKTLDGTITDWNNAAEKMYGYKKSEIVGKNIKIVVPKNKLKELGSIYKKIAYKNGIQNFETKRLRKDGTVIGISLTISPIIDDRNKMIGYSTISRDITKIKKAEEDLKKSEEKYRHLVEGLSHNYFFYTHDVKGIFTYISPSIENILGYLPQKFLTHYSKYLTDNPINKKVREYTRLSLKGITQAPYLVEIYDSKKKARTFEVTEEPVFDENNMVVGVDGIAKDITNQVEIERFLKQNRAELYSKNLLLQGVLDGIPDIVGIQKPDHSIIMYNKAGYKFLAKKPSEVAGKKCYELIGKSKPCEPCATSNALNTKKISIIERYEKGLKIWLECRSIPVLNSKGKVEVIVEILRDITQRRASETEIKKQKDYAETILRLVPSAVFTVDMNKTVKSWNKKAEEITGYKTDEVIGKICTLFAKKPCEEKCGLFANIINEPIKNRICTIRTKYGEVRQINKNADYLTDENGNIIGGIESFEDVTEKNKVDEKLREFSRVVEQSPSIVVITDTEGNIEYVNPKFSKITGYNFNEVKGKNPRILKSGETPYSNYYADLWNTIKSGKEWRGEFHNKKKNGELYWERASITAMRDTDGKIYHFLAIKEDITDKKLAEKELLRLASFPELNPNPIFEVDVNGMVTYMNPVANVLFPSLKDEGRNNILLRDFGDIVKKILNSNVASFIDEIPINEKVFERNISHVVQENKFRFYLNDVTERKRVDKLKDEFVSTVSHELRTPLSITKEGISLVLDRIPGELNEKQEKLLNTSKDNIDRLSRIINDLLDISKMESGKVELVVSNFNLSDLVDKIVFEFDSKLKTKNLSIRKNIPECLIITADVDKVSQVFINLINNAIKFTNSGFIEISAVDIDSKVKISVRDTGLGIPREFIPNIFSKFTQFGRIDGPGEKGTGLGLSIVKKLVEMHNGKIWVESEKNKGTVFWIEMPKVYDISEKHVNV